MGDDADRGVGDDAAGGVGDDDARGVEDSSGDAIVACGDNPVRDTLSRVTGAGVGLGEKTLAKEVSQGRASSFMPLWEGTVLQASQGMVLRLSRGASLLLPPQGTAPRPLVPLGSNLNLLGTVGAQLVPLGSNWMWEWALSH